MLPPLPFSSEMRRTLSSTRRKGRISAVGVLGVWQNWVDFVRAALGAYLLTNFVILVDNADSGADLTALGMKAVVLGVAVLVQTVRLLRTVQILAPVFFLCGLTLILGGYLQGAFAIGVGWLFAIGGKNLTYQLPAMAVALAAAGCVLGFALPLLVDCSLILVPPILSVLFRRPLVFAATTPAVA
jgi:hypothetical protein